MNDKVLYRSQLHLFPVQEAARGNPHNTGTRPDMYEQARYGLPAQLMCFHRCAEVFGILLGMCVCGTETRGGGIQLERKPVAPDRLCFDTEPSLSL